MIVVVSDRQRLVHILGLTHLHIVSLESCIASYVYRRFCKKAADPCKAICEAVRTVKALTFYDKEYRHLCFLSWYQVDALYLIVNETLAGRVDFFLDEIFEALETALDVRKKIYQ